nr:ribosomal protein L36 [Coccidia sp. AB-2023a]
MKVRTSIKRICINCIIIRRKKQLYVKCYNKKHNQHQK